MNYRTLLLDADGTLLDFQKAEARGLEATMRIHGLPFDADILAAYSGINKKCWEEFEQGLMDKETLLSERFRRLIERLHLRADAGTLQDTYHTELGKGAYLIEGAYETCAQLKEVCRLYIVTNGVSDTQHSRFAASGLDKLADGIFVSEDVGYPKPQKEYFDYVFSQIPGFCREETLLVGDSLTADIQGGINAGLDTCWYNPQRLARPDGMRIDYELADIRDLKTLIYH